MCAGSNRSKSAETTLRIIDNLKKADGMRLTELATELDMAKSSIHRYLQALLQSGYTIKEGETYYLSLRFLEHGDYVRNRKQVFKLAEEKAIDIADRTGERAVFFVEEHGEAVYVHREVGEEAVISDEGLGSRIKLHLTAGGKAILAEWPDDKIEAYADQCKFEQHTSETITNKTELLDDIEGVRERGYAINNEDAIKGLRAIGSSICNPQDEVLGALSISGPLHRMKGQRLEDDLPQFLLGVTNELELNLQYS